MHLSIPCFMALANLIYLDLESMFYHTLFPPLELAPIMWMTLSNCTVHGGYCLWFAKGMESHRPFFLNFIIIAPLFLPQPDFPLEMK